MSLISSHIRPFVDYQVDSIARNLVYQAFNPPKVWTASPAWLTTDEGTLYIDFTENNWRTAPAANHRLFWLGGSLSNDADVLTRTASTNRASLSCWRSNASQLALEYNHRTMVAGRMRVAFAYKAGKITCFLNGRRLWSKTGVNPPASWAGVGILNGPSGTTNQSSATANEVRFYNRSLTDFELQRLTHSPRMVADLTPPDPETDVYIFAGQSNPDGRESLSHTYTNTDKMHMLRHDMTVQAYSDPWGTISPSNFFSSGGTNFLGSDSGAGTGYAGKVADGLIGITGRHTLVVNACRGATSITPDWSPDTVFTGVTGFGVCGICAIDKMQVAQQLGRLRGFIWHQGENDAAAATSRSDYFSRTAHFFEQVRLNADRADLPIFVVGLHSFDPSTQASPTYPASQWTAIRNAQQDLAANLPNVHYIDASDLTGIVSDPVHLSLASQITLASRIVTEMTPYL